MRPIDTAFKTLKARRIPMKEGFTSCVAPTCLAQLPVGTQTCPTCGINQSAQYKWPWEQ